MSAAKRRSELVDVDRRVRRNAGSAGLAAGLLIFFGFFWIEGAVGPPLFLQAHYVFHYTLKIGGIMMALVALWSSWGHPLALLFDAVVSCLIGAILVVTAVLMAIGGGSLLPTFIVVVCGVLFISAGLRNGRDFFQFPVVVEKERDEAADQVASFLGGRPEGERSAETNASLPSELLKRSPKSADAEPEHPARTTGGPRFAARDDAIRLPGSDAPASRGDVKPSLPQEEQEADEKRKPKGPPPPGGYLANLADDDPPDQP